jgi:hypothetical protein
VNRPACTLRPGRRLRASTGDVEASWAPREGGRLALRLGALAASLDVVVQGHTTAGPVELRQSYDVEPTLVPLEEGAERVGVRSLWSLVEEDDELGYGEAMQDVFVTRHGEVFVALALRIVTRSALVVERAAVELSLDGIEEIDVEDAELRAHARDGALLMTWPRGRGRRFDTIQWQQSQAPFYERWPPLFDQWSLDDATFGWERFRGAGASAEPVESGSATAALAWIEGGAVPASPQLDLRGLIWLGLGDEERLRALASAHDEPLVPRVEGARLRCYDELDGAYEVTAGVDDDCTIEFPADPLERPLRVRVFGLAALGGLEAETGSELQHLSERGRVDDPLVWVEVDADRRADEVLVVADASADRPTRLSLRGREGLHVAYQRRDSRRRLTVHHPADLERPIATIDLSSLHLVGLRIPGSVRPAVYDAPLFWMRYLPKAAAHIANALNSFEVVETAPELVAVAIESQTPDGLVHSRYRVEFPYRADHVEVRIRAELEGAAAWGLPTFEFADLFPEDGIDPSRWEYDTIAFVGPDDVRVVDTRRPYPGLDARVSFPVSVLEAMPAGHALPGCGPFAFSRRSAVVFGGSDRGTIVAVSANDDPARVEQMTTLCEHWADVHFDAAAVGSRPASSESVARQPVAEPVPDSLVAELSLRVYDPALVSFDEAVESARLDVRSAEDAPL